MHDVHFYYRLIEAKDTGFRVPIDKTVKRLKKSKNYCSNYSECIFSVYQIISNYIQNSGQYTINLSSRTRRGILYRLAWVEQFVKPPTTHTKTTTNHLRVSQTLHSVSNEPQTVPDATPNS